MRKFFAWTLVAIFTVATVSPALAYQQGQEGQQEQEQQRTFRGTLESVDTEAETLTIKYSADSDPVTVEVRDDTKLEGPDGELTLADLAEHQGEDLQVVYVMESESVVALEVQLVA